MARRPNRVVSTVLSAALLILSVGFDVQQAAAQRLTGRVAPVSLAPQLGFGIASAPMPSAAISESIAAAAPALRELAKSETGGAAASGAGRDLEAVLTGEQPIRKTDELVGVSARTDVVGALSARFPTLTAPTDHKPTRNPPSVPSSGKGSRGETYRQFGLLGLFLGAGVLGFYVFAHTFSDIIRAGEEAVRSWQNSGFSPEADVFLGLGMLAGTLRSGAKTPKVTDD